MTVMATTQASVSLLLSEKELEVARLREQALTSLEGKLQDKEQQLAIAHSKFHHLQQDYEYNLELLDGRDAELEQYDIQFAALKQELLAQEQLVAQLRSGLAHAGSELRMAKESSEEAASSAEKKVHALEDELTQTKAAHEQALLQQVEQANQAQRQLERQLSEAESALQKQWRDLTASFEDQLRHLELECTTKLEQAAQQVQLLSQTAADREAEAQQAHNKERATADTAAAAMQQAHDLQKQHKAALSDIDRLRQSREARTLQLEQDCQRLQQQIAALEDDHKGNVAELVADVDAIKKAMADQQVDYEMAAQRAKQQQEEELSLLKARLATVTGQRSQLQADLGEARTMLKLTSRQASERLERIAADHESHLSRTQAQLADAQRQHEEDLRQSRQECWTLQQDLTAAHGKLAGLKATLEDRRKDLISYKEQLVSAGERERELQRQLTQAALQAEAALEGCHMAASAESEHLVKSLIQQRDYANDALLEAQSSVLAKEDELAAVKQELQSVKAQQSNRSESDSAQARSAQHSAAGASGTARGAMHSRADLAQGRAVADSGLPSPSLPATPHSPAGSPKGGLADLRASLEQGMAAQPSQQGMAAQPSQATLLAEQQQLKVALREAQEQNQRLAQTVSAMRADMETMQRHTGSPGPLAQPPNDRMITPQMSPHTNAARQQHLSVPINAALHRDAASNLLDAALGSPAHQQQQQQLIAAVEAVKISQQSEIDQLRQQLQDTQQASEEIAAENERLMELSSALRSERDRAVESAHIQTSHLQQPHLQQPWTKQSQAQSQQLTAAPQAQQLQVAFAGSHQQPPLTLPPGPRPQSLPGSNPQQEYYLGYAYPMLQQQLPVQHYGEQQQQQPSAYQHSGGQISHNVCGQSNSLQQPSEQGHKAAQQAEKPLQGKIASEEVMSSEVWQRLQRIETLAEQISAAQSTKQGANRIANSNTDSAVSTISGVPANAAAHQPRPQTASDRSTPSQRAKLKALQQRQNPRARVRNYNQQDDVNERQ